MDKDKIIDYVMTTPGNMNKMVLEGMLGDTDGVKLPEISEEDEGKVLTVIDGKWDKGVASGDKGYECTEERTLLTDESVTTATSNLSTLGRLAYSTPITADTIKVTFNGVEYTCQKMSDNDYGAPYNISTRTFDWSEYPFNIISDSIDNVLTTETAGTYQIKIEAFEESVETSECFEKAVNKVVGGSGGGTLVVRVDHIEGTPPNENIILDKTWKEVRDALANGICVICVDQESDTYVSNDLILLAQTDADNGYVVQGIRHEGDNILTTSYHACSEDGYLQSEACSGGGGGTD